MVMVTTFCFQRGYLINNFYHYICTKGKVIGMIDGVFNLLYGNLYFWLLFVGIPVGRPARRRGDTSTR